MSDKIPWAGTITGVQPRIRLTRSFDQSSHSYLGYVLRVDGTIGGEQREFVVAIGKAAQVKHAFRAGDQVSGESEPVEDARTEVAELYKTARLKLVNRPATDASSPPPWLGVPPPDLEVYRARGHRRLDPKTYDSKCGSCMWGAKMAVEIVIDQWDQSKVKWRVETFCYGPKSCSVYRPGARRQVPGRKGMSYLEDDWVDEEATRHRGPDE
ncbi:MAG: hypothetical protein HS104_11515 [Polyangiaceae bacterium]|nr:hypothetical protein [Polyangiaceae bacterium]MCL4748594.1 hypothetical protein [Myxococcales bacterium]